MIRYAIDYSEDMMNHKNLLRILTLIMITALALTACGNEPKQEKIKPAELVPQTDGRNLIILTERAAERLGIQTEVVREEQVMKFHLFGGEVMIAPDSPEKAMIRVSIPEDEMTLIDQNSPVRVLPLGADDDEDDDDDEREGMFAEFDEQLGFDDDEDDNNLVGYYVVNETEHNLLKGQKLLVEFSGTAVEGTRLMVPSAAVVYDINGQTWVYTNPETLTYLREPILVDYFLDGTAVLLEGPTAGTRVATVGVAELFGTDTGVGK
jgi:hypothetical protein